MKIVPYQDIAKLPEDERIVGIGRRAERGMRVTFIVETDEKADRYIEKLTSRYKVRVDTRIPGPVKGTVSVVIVRKEEEADDEGHLPSN